MRCFRLSLLCLGFYFLFPTLVFANRPVCVRNKDAIALNNLIPKSPQRKVAGKKIKKEEPKPAKENPMKINQYTPLSWTGKQEGRWLEVRNMSGQTFWMRQKDLTSSMNCLSVRVDQSRMYSGPGPDFEKAEIAKKGDVFVDLGGEDGWTQVQSSDGKKAWINLDHIWRPAARMRMTFSPEQ